MLPLLPLLLVSGSHRHLSPDNDSAPSHAVPTGQLLTHFHTSPVLPQASLAPCSSQTNSSLVRSRQVTDIPEPCPPGTLSRRCPLLPLPPTSIINLSVLSSFLFPSFHQLSSLIIYLWFNILFVPPKRW